MKSNLSIAIILIICLSALLCQDEIINKEVVVNGAVILPCPCSANAPVVWSMVDPTKAEIAKCESTTCTISPDFKNRFAFVDADSGNFSLSISKAAYNNDGTYECCCDGKPHDVKLRVFVPHIVTANEGDNVTLPCFIRAKDVKNMIWKANGTNVLQYNYENKSLTLDKDLKGRVALDEGGFSGGDYSLHMRSVRQADTGLYRCLFQDGHYEGDPRAVQLIVNGKQPQPSVDAAYVLLCIALVVSVFMDIAFIVHRIYERSSKRPQPETSSNVSCPVQEQSPLIPDATLKSSTVPIQDE